MTAKLALTFKHKKLLDYTQWRNFETVINKAKDACKNAGQSVDDHFADVSKMVDIGSGSKQQSKKRCYSICTNILCRSNT